MKQKTKIFLEKHNGEGHELDSTRWVSPMKPGQIELTCSCGDSEWVEFDNNIDEIYMIRERRIGLMDEIKKKGRAR